MIGQGISSHTWAPEVRLTYGLVRCGIDFKDKKSWALLTRDSVKGNKVAKVNVNAERGKVNKVNKNINAGRRQ